MLPLVLVTAIKSDRGDILPTASLKKMLPKSVPPVVIVISVTTNSKDWGEPAKELTVELKVISLARRVVLPAIVTGLL
ncbi:MAG: hypothetical protein D6822_06980 [Cyanobacteria bacterium J149]|nr:MAG: hypothetical protein D6822_06980 [Cyanobacteria bacterium J149]